MTLGGNKRFSLQFTDKFRACKLIILVQ